VKIANSSIFLVALVGGLISGRAPLYAQSTIAPVAAGDDNAPWNQGVNNETREAARAVFLEGNRLFKIPLFARAAEKYIEALSQWKHPAFYFNLALAQLNLAEDLEAHKALELALQHGEVPLGAEHFQEARKQLQEVERRLGRLRIRCRLSGAEVTMDGATLFRGPGSYEGWAEAKAHEIVAKKPEYLPKTRRVTVAAGQLQDLELKLVTLDEAADAGRRWAKWKPWTVVAAGITLGAGGGALHALSAHSFQTYDKEFLKLPCSGFGCKKAEVGPALNTQLSHARLEQKIAVGGYIAGGSLVAAGIALVYLNRPRLVEQQNSSSIADRVAVAPTVSTSMVGILMTVRH
jgi:tetratricopeptide (TPR) repeat protein